MSEAQAFCMSIHDAELSKNSNEPAEHACLEFEKTSCTFSIQPWWDFTRHFTRVWSRPSIVGPDPYSTVYKVGSQGDTNRYKFLRELNSSSKYVEYIPHVTVPRDITMSWDPFNANDEPFRELI